MTDDKADNIPEPTEEVIQTESQATPEAEVEAPEAEANRLTDLMAGENAETTDAPKKPAVDLEKQALEAAAQAVKKGEKALVDADRQLVGPRRQPVSGNKRELVLRLLLAVNVLAMVVVAMLPNPSESQDATPAGPVEPAPTTAVEEPAPTPSMSEPWNQALRASERRDFAAAVSILEAYLQDKPRMAPSERLSVLSALSFYTARDKDFSKSRRYSQQAQALEQSHSLPDDLVEEAAAALESGDQESLRRIWARFLLQRRQIPTWLYQHVAQAYLELGDSYRQDADEAERRARREELEQAAERLRAEALEREGKK